MKKILSFIHRFLSVFWGAGAAFLWTMGGPLYDIWYGSALALLFGAALFFVPWHKVEWLRLILNGVTAVAAFIAAGLWISKDVLPTSPPWAIWIWMVFIVTALFFLGKKALRKSVWLPALSLAVGLIFLWALSLTDANLSNIEPPHRRSFWMLAVDLPILLGGALTGDFAEKDRRVKWGGVLSAGIWFTLSVTAAFVWNYEAASLLPNTVSAAWSRISVFSIFSHPEVPLLSLLAASSLWHCALFLCQMITLYRNKVLLYNRKVQSNGG